MSNHITEKSRQAAEIKARKRAEALRDNLKRRKAQAVQDDKREENAKPENRE